MSDDTKTKNNLYHDILLAAANIVSPQACYRPEDSEYVIVPADLFNKLVVCLSALNERVKDGAQLNSIVRDTKRIEVPGNVATTLRQYHTWGVDLWDYSAVERKCMEFCDHDVLAWIVQYREEYKYVVSQIL